VPELIRLGVNIDHVATVRQARRASYPDLVEAARLAERGFIDAVIEPHETRLLLRKSMRLLRDKQIQRVNRKHGLTPI